MAATATFSSLTAGPPSHVCAVCYGTAAAPVAAADDVLESSEAPREGRKRTRFANDVERSIAHDMLECRSCGVRVHSHCLAPWPRSSDSCSTVKSDRSSRRGRRASSRGKRQRDESSDESEADDAAPQTNGHRGGWMCELCADAGSPRSHTSSLAPPCILCGGASRNNRAMCRIRVEPGGANDPLDLLQDRRRKGKAHRGRAAGRGTARTDKPLYPWQDAWAHIACARWVNTAWRVGPASLSERVAVGALPAHAWMNTCVLCEHARSESGDAEEAQLCTFPFSPPSSSAGHAAALKAVRSAARGHGLAVTCSHGTCALKFHPLCAAAAGWAVDLTVTPDAVLYPRCGAHTSESALQIARSRDAVCEVCRARECTNAWGFTEPQPRLCGHCGVASHVSCQDASWDAKLGVPDTWFCTGCAAKLQWQGCVMQLPGSLLPRGTAAPTGNTARSSTAPLVASTAYPFVMVSEYMRALTRPRLRRARDFVRAAEAHGTVYGGSNKEVKSKAATNSEEDEELTIAKGAYRLTDADDEALAALEDELGFSVTSVFPSHLPFVAARLASQCVPFWLSTVVAQVLHGSNLLVSGSGRKAEPCIAIAAHVAPSAVLVHADCSHYSWSPLRVASLVAAATGAPSKFHSGSSLRAVCEALRAAGDANEHLQSADPRRASQQWLTDAFTSLHAASSGAAAASASPSLPASRTASLVQRYRRAAPATSISCVLVLEHADEWFIRAHDDAWALIRAVSRHARVRTCLLTDKPLTRTLLDTREMLAGRWMPLDATTLVPTEFQRVAQTSVFTSGGAASLQHILATLSRDHARLLAILMALTTDAAPAVPFDELAAAVAAELMLSEVSLRALLSELVDHDVLALRAGCVRVSVSRDALTAALDADRAGEEADA